jgi:hypothetical protein
MSKDRNHVAYAEDCEEDSGSSVEGIEATRKYAISEAPVSPVKERPNTGKSRSEKRPSHRRSESSSASHSLTDSSDSTARSSKREKESRRPSQREIEREEQRERERRKRDRKLKLQAQAEEDDRRAMAEAKALKKVRPQSLRHSVTQPVVQQAPSYRRGRVEDPSSYGVPQPAASSARPNAKNRPASYYAGQTSRPPIANMPWHQAHPPAAPHYPHMVGTFPPPLHMLPPSPASQASHVPPSPIYTPGYFDAAMSGQHGQHMQHGQHGQPGQHSHLKHRFDARPSSAMGIRTPSSRGYPPDEELESVSTKLSRRQSRGHKKTEDDRRKMPPPEFVPIPRRPQSAMPQSSPFAPPPPPQSQRPSSRRGQSRPPAPHRRSVGFAEQLGYEDEDFLDEVGSYHDTTHVAAYEPRRTPSGRTRSSTNAYEYQGLDIVPANSRTRTVAPYSGGGVPIGSYGTSYDAEQYMSALRYQEDVSGPQMPLTAETLRNVSKRGGVPSSRSTRSSGSRDDSEYKRSNTTGITRSSSGNNEDLIIKVSGTSVVRIPGAEIECSDGEIMFSTRPGGGGSDLASAIFQIEDGRGRYEQKALPLRARAPSQSDSQSRGYAPSHAPYDRALASEYPYWWLRWRLTTLMSQNNFFSVPWIGTSWKRAISLFLSLCFSLYFFSSGINLDLRYTFVFSASSTTYGLGILIFPS